MSALDANLVPRRSPFSAQAGRSARTGLLRLGPRRLLGALTVIAVFFAVWAFLAPPQLGGSTSYVILDGTSMLPNFHTGDLVLLRKESSYHVGEVAGYRDMQAGGATIMHRIVAIEGGHYVFKGDNNAWTDSYEPTESQIVGAEWVHLSGWGNLILDLRAPLVGAIILGLLWLFLFWPRSGTRRQRRRHRHAH
jgi:signal peptidase I